ARRLPAARQRRGGPGRARTGPVRPGPAAAHRLPAADGRGDRTVRRGGPRPVHARRRRAVPGRERGQHVPPAGAEPVTRSPAMRLTSVLAVAALALSGCALVDEVPQMPGPRETDLVPTEVPPAEPEGETLSPDGFDTVERMAVRIRNVGCGALTTGSGFAIDSQVLITNRH